jgi:hypothetical protein
LIRPGRFPLALVVFLLVSPRAEAWPADLSQRIARDALKILPKSLAEIFLANEAEIFADARTTSMPALPLIYSDLPRGRLAEPTRQALSAEFAERVKALRGPEFRTAVIALGATYRLAVDLADPSVGLGIGTDAKAKTIRREFYAFTSNNLDKIPVVLVEPDSMRLPLDRVPAFLDTVTTKTPSQATLLREEAQEGGRVLPANEIDFRSPVFAVASTAYSRSVCAVAATWIAIWRAAGGDMTRQKPPTIVKPRPFGLKNEEN